jgi:hypothetical protein
MCALDRSRHGLCARATTVFRYYLELTGNDDGEAACVEMQH